MSVKPLALLAALSIPLAFAQIAGAQQATPVREVGAFARTSMRGLCVTVVNVGQQDSGVDPCTLQNTNGTFFGALVPEKKILVLEDASVRCTRSTQDSISEVSVVTNGATLRILPLTVIGTDGGKTRAAGFTSGRAYLRAGERVATRVTLGSPAEQSANCVAVLSGYLVDEQ